MAGVVRAKVQVAGDTWGRCREAGIEGTMDGKGAGHCGDTWCTPLSAMPVEYHTRAVEDRTVFVQGPLADRGQHRAPSVPDLLLAATGEWPI